MNAELVRAAHAQKMFEQRESHIGHLPAQILLDLARNEAATREWRKAAVELLIDKGFPQANHSDLTGLVMEIKAERAAKQEVEAVVETAIEEEVKPFEPRVIAPALTEAAAELTNNIIDSILTANVPESAIQRDAPEAPAGIPTHRLDPDVLPAETLGPFTASVTADTIGRDDVIEN